MAVQWSSETMQRTGDLWSEFPERIQIVASTNGRHEDTDITALAADIEKNGQKTPCLFRKGENNETILVYGHRRYRAVMYLNAQPGATPRKLMGTYMRTSGNKAEQEALIAAIGENRFRTDVSAIDDSYNIGLLVERYQRSLEEIAAIYFPEATTEAAKAESVRWVKDRHGLLELVPEAQDAVREGRIKVTAAKTLAKLGPNRQREKLAEKPEGRIKGKDIKAPKKPPSLKALMISIINDLKAEDLNNAEFEWIEVNRLKLKRLAKALDVDIKEEAAGE